MISQDIQHQQEKCQKCSIDAPSQPKSSPVVLEQPCYPFQWISADFFEVKGKEFLVIIDRQDRRYQGLTHRN